MAHSARPVDLDGVIEHFVLLSDQRKDDFEFELWRQHSNNVTLLAFVNCCYCQNMLWLEMIIQTNAYAGGTQSERGGNNDDFNELLCR